MWRNKPLAVSSEGWSRQGDSIFALPVLPGGHGPCSHRGFSVPWQNRLGLPQGLELCPCPSQKDLAFPTYSSDGQFPDFKLMRLEAILALYKHHRR